jgi:hypothetical protein
MTDDTRQFLKNLKLWFNANRPAIITGHEGERVLIMGNSVQGYFPNDAAALAAAESNGFEYGTFLIQDCITQEQELKRHRYRGARFVGL